MKEIKVSWNEVLVLLEKTYGIKENDIRFMRIHAYEGDLEICEKPHYIIGEMKTQSEVSHD